MRSGDAITEQELERRDEQQEHQHLSQLYTNVEGQQRRQQVCHRRTAAFR